ncbi:MAG: hypothetical protein ACM3JG_06750 [Thiohalocapsa sp.]
MRVFDLIDRAGATGNAARIAAIGSCRIDDPFEALAESGRAHRVWANINATTHTLGEARQMIDFVRGDRDIAAALQPFVFGPEPPPPPLPPVRRLLDGVDAIFVEVCNPWEVQHPPYYFQMDHFFTQFVSQHGGPLRRWYRRFLQGEAGDEGEIAQALDQLARLPVEERAVAEAVLRTTCLRRLDREAAAAGVAETMFKAGFEARKTWVFVSHFVVPGIDGTQMADRAELIDIVGEAAARHGARFFDPSTLIARHGREAALARGGQDLFHYNPQLHETIADALLDAAHLEVRQRRVAVAAVGDTTVAAVAAKLGPAAMAAARVNETLLRVHRDRVNALGVEGSGLHAHYKQLLDDGAIAGAPVAELAELIIELLPSFDNHYVLRAGLGELAFVLARLGMRAAAFDADSSRVGAIEAGCQALIGEQPALADRIAIAHIDIPEVPPGERVLAVLPDFGFSKQNERRQLARLARYPALLVAPRLFLHLRESTDEQEAVVQQLRSCGFTDLREFPRLGLLYCERAERDASESRRRPRGLLNSMMRRLQPRSQSCRSP